jgi:hypothetical protein
MNVLDALANIGPAIIENIFLAFIILALLLFAAYELSKNLTEFVLMVCGGILISLVIIVGLIVA